MVRGRGALSVSVSVLAASQLLYDPAGHAQPPPAGQPDAQAQDSDVWHPPPPRPPLAAGPIVTLRADSVQARLQMLGQELSWLEVCGAPCNLPLNPAGAYRIGGGGTIPPSETFNLPRTSSVLIDARVGSTVKRKVGLGLILGGAGAVLAGGAVYASASDDQADVNGNNASRTVGHIFGVFFAVVGLALLAVGIPLSLSSTSVDVR